MNRYPPRLLETPLSASEICKLTTRLTELAESVDANRVWPEESIATCADAGVFRWFVPKEFGGWNWSDTEILAGYLALSRSCMTTAFILTQWHAACRRLLSGSNLELRKRIAPQLASGETFVTVGISHLTTSRQHVSQPVLRATRIDGGFRLDGTSPWVTAGSAANLIVLGATLEDGSQILAAVPAGVPGMNCYPGLELVALSASCTDRIDLEGVLVTDSDVLDGPIPNVMQKALNSGGAAGGLPTSALAIGLASIATDYMQEQASHRPTLKPIADPFRDEVDRLQHGLFQLGQAGAGSETGSFTQLRQQANSIVLRSTQAALQIAKGAGFVSSHPVGRWAREALFFLVWSCPQEVTDANLCELVSRGRLPEC